MTSPTRNPLALALLGAVQLAALFGDRLKQFSYIAMLGLYAPGSSFELLKLNLFAQIPMLLFSPLVGALLDHWNRRLAIAGACAVRAVLVFAFPLVFVRFESLYVLYAAAFVLSTADLVFAPARAAVLPEVVPADRLLSANAAFWTLGIVGALAGFLVGGWLFDFRGWAWAFRADALAYAAAAVLMAPLLLTATGRTAPAPSAAPPRAREGLRALTRSVGDGARLIGHDRRIAISLVAQSSMFAVGGALSVIGIARIHEVAPAAGTLFLGIIGSSLVAGLLAGAAMAALFRRREHPERTISVSAMLCGVAITGLGRTEGVVALSIWAGLLGVAISPPFILTETLVQRASPGGFYGRVFAAREALVKVAYLGAAIVATAASTLVSKSAILVGMGLFLALLGVALERTSWLRTDASPER
jgi:MFS family permease